MIGPVALTILIWGSIVAVLLVFGYLLVQLRAGRNR